MVPTIGCATDVTHNLLLRKKIAKIDFNIFNYFMSKIVSGYFYIFGHISLNSEEAKKGSLPFRNVCDRCVKVVDLYVFGSRSRSIVQAH